MPTATGTKNLAVTSSLDPDGSCGSMAHNGGATFVYFGGPEGLDQDGVSVPSPEPSTPGYGIGVSTAGDIDRDGLADLAIPVADRVLFYVGGDSREFVARGSVSNPSVQPRTTCCADLDADGRDDLVASRSGGVALVTNGQLQALDGPIVVPPLQFSLDVALPDLDGDGNAHLVAGSCGNGFYDSEGDVYVRNAATGAFIPLERTGAFELGASFYACYLSSLGDVDGDGRDDLAAAAPFTLAGGTAGQAIVWLDGGTRNLSLTGTTHDENSGRTMAGVGDLDGDGLDDIVLSSVREPHEDFTCTCGDGSSCACPAGSVEIFLGRADLDGARSDRVLWNPMPAYLADFGYGIAAAYP